MKHGTEIELVVDRLGEKGRSSGDVDGRRVNVAGALPGDRVRARVLSKRKGEYEAALLELLAPGPDRVEPRCRYFGDCGGCRWQHLSYEAQLEAKRAHIEEVFRRLGVLGHREVPKPLAAEATYYYRNKMEFSFGANRWLTAAEVASGEEHDRDFALGMFVPGRFDRIVDLQWCWLQSERSAEIVNAIRDLAKREGWAAWDARRHEGWLRHLVIRTSELGEVMVNLVTSSLDPERLRLLGTELLRRFEITTLVNTINAGVAQVSAGTERHVLHGEGVIVERLGKHEFEIGPESFFQTNTRQAERLYEVVRDFAALRPSDRVYDLFCGVGTITLFLADSAREVIGVELVGAAVADAERNARRNQVSNVTFRKGDLLDLLAPDFVQQHGAPDVVVLDPPRAGVHPKALEALRRLEAPRLVYVSCNPKTQANDLQVLCRSYRVQAIQPVDLFPHTEHVENVVLLERG